MVVTWMDWLYIFIVVLSMAVGGYRGFLREFISLLIIALSVYLGYLMALPATEFLTEFITDEQKRLWIGFVVMSLITNIILGIFVRIVFSNIELGPSIVNMLAGAIYGIGRGVFINILIAIVVIEFNYTATSWWQDSNFAPTMQEAYQWIAPFIPELLDINIPTDSLPMLSQ